MAYLIISNNPKVNDVFSDQYTIDFQPEATYLEILEHARNLVHEGAILLSHPLAGSVKPNQTPYRSLLLDYSPFDQTLARSRPPLDQYSLHLIENSLEATQTFLNNRPTTAWPETILQDFQTVDYSLIKSAIQRI